MEKVIKRGPLAAVAYDWTAILDGEYLVELLDCINNQQDALRCVMQLVVKSGISELNAELELQKDYLEQGAIERNLSSGERTKLKSLKLLDPWEDIESSYTENGMHVWFQQYGKIYKKYLREAVDSFNVGTGITIQGGVAK